MTSDRLVWPHPSKKVENRMFPYMAWLPSRVAFLNKYSSFWNAVFEGKTSALAMFNGEHAFCSEGTVRLFAVKHEHRPEVLVMNCSDRIYLLSEEQLGDQRPILKKKWAKDVEASINRLLANGDAPSMTLDEYRALTVDTPAQIPRKVDPQRRIKIEKSAIEVVTAYFTHHGYDIDSVEADNVGWDLNAVKGIDHLRLEVKGLSGDTINFELTANEYEKARNHASSYRICVVTSALNDKNLFIYGFDPISALLTELSGLTASIPVQEKTAARFRIQSFQAVTFCESVQESVNLS